MNIETVAIGSELLLGEILDTNTQTIARMLRDEGHALQRAAIVGDHPPAIVRALRDAADRADAVIACGGLGPTVDDPTRESAAEAAGVELVFHPDLWDDILARFRTLGRTPTENNRKQALLPAGAEALPNPFGTAPGFALPLGRSILFAVPGVPSEMEAMVRDRVLPALRRRAGGAGVIRKRTLHVAGLGESQIDAQMGRWESMENPSVGLMAHAGLTDIRIVGRGASEEEALQRIAEAEDDIRAGLGANVVGADEETLAGAVLRLLPAGATLATAEFGTGGALAGMLAAEDSERYAGGSVCGRTAYEGRDLADILLEQLSQQRATYAAGLVLTTVKRGYRSEYLLHTPAASRRKTRTHLVPHPMAARWAAAFLLTAFWKMLGESGADSSAAE
jgi:nicotinamide-nucleotide amidase